MNTIADIRKDYRLRALNEADVDADAIQQFSNWWNDALHAEIDEANAMTLATSSLEGKPSARVVLLKGFDQKGFVFYTNYESRKGIELAENPQASLVFFWKELERQVRINGLCEKVSAEESDRYFSSRPKESRIGAWASPQSRVISQRDELENNVAKYQEIYREDEVARPSHWGGYILKASQIEFWQGRPGRLHDRLQYTLINDSKWKIDRLAP